MISRQKPGRYFRCLTVHAESLQERDVWQQVARLAATISERGGRITFFVHPQGAIDSRVDLAGRLSWLRGLGHEIGQHSHYFGPPRPGLNGGHPPTELTETNILRCMESHYRYLRGAGADPVGYVSGGWAIHDAIFAWLRDKGFQYDCSFRTYRLSYNNPSAAAGDTAEGPFLNEGLLEIPTTAGLAGFLKSKATGRGGSVAAGDISYDLYYLHDTDLLKPLKRAALNGLESLLLRAESRVAVRDLARHVERARV